MIRHRIDESGENTSWALVTMQRSRGADAALAAGKLVAGVSVLTISRYSKRQADVSTGAMVAVRRRSLTEEEQSLLKDWGGMFEDTTQMVVQYGYVALFAAACPLTPLISLINNIIEVRSDAFKLSTLVKRPNYMRDATGSVGAWHEILHALSVVAVLVNAMTLCFVGSQVAAHVTDDPGMEVSIDMRFKSWQLWALRLLLEHSVLMVRKGVKCSAPAEAKWVSTARDTLAYQEKHMRTLDEDEAVSSHGIRCV